MARKANRNSGAKRSHTTLLAVLAVGMFGFAFALVPLYEVFCELTGINGKTSAQAVAAITAKPDGDRVVTIQFLAKTSKGLAWDFRPVVQEMQVKIGEVHTTRFYVRNRSNKAVTAQAVPSVTPGLAALHLKKIECFCFSQQQLAANSEMEMPLQFYIDADLPEDISTLSLSYTMYPVSVAQSAQIHTGNEVAAR